MSGFNEKLYDGGLFFIDKFIYKYIQKCIYHARRDSSATSQGWGENQEFL